jgi:hypothetical protein
VTEASSQAITTQQLVLTHFLGGMPLAVTCLELLQEVGE